MDNQENRFGVSLFGYNRRKVNEYIYENITLLSKENGALKARNAEIVEELDKLKGMQDEIINGKDAIASAILAAEEKAKQIIKDATLDAEVKVAAIMGQMDEAKKRFESEKVEMNSFKQEIMNVLKKTADNIDEITKADRPDMEFTLGSAGQVAEFRRQIKERL